MSRSANISTRIIFIYFLQYLLMTFGLTFISDGELRVQPASPVLMGSSLTVYCFLKNTELEESKEGFDILLEVNDKIVKTKRPVNRTTMVFTIPSVRTPVSKVFCKLKRDQEFYVFSGLEIKAGFPPDKPRSIICSTTKLSETVECSWRKGRPTFISTNYNVSISRNNGTVVHLDVIQDAEEVTIDKGLLDENTTYMLTVSASNKLGASQSHPISLQDIVIPETPEITLVEFEKDSLVALLHWKTMENSQYIRPYIRLNDLLNETTWEEVEGVEIHESLIQVENVRPLTEYEFQLKTCIPLKHMNTTSFTNWTKTSEKSVCSRWSSSERKTSPGKGPSQRLEVWRTTSGRDTNGTQRVTVLWKPLPAGDYSGDVQGYKISWFTDQNHQVVCPPAGIQCSVQVSAEVQILNISAFTLYGTSPPAKLALTHSDVPAPVLGTMTAAGSDGTMMVSWPQREKKQQSELLYYVIEWISLPAARLQWKKLDKDLQHASITGLTVGVRYRVSLYAVTPAGVSGPSSRLLYSKENKPVSGPNLSVLVHAEGRIHVQWDELPLQERRGFITNYTLYFQPLDSTNTDTKVLVAASGQRKMWLDCLGGSLVLQMTASTSAGEGPPGRRISSHPTAPSHNLVIVIVFFITVFIAIIGNLMCWSCVRKRIKQSCLSWGPSWLVENRPEPGHSNAILLLKHDSSEPLHTSIQYDPPLSNITVISQDQRDEVYPVIHIEVPRTESPEEPSVVSHPCFVSTYKPQTAPSAHQGLNTTENMQTTPPAKWEEDGLLVDFLSNVRENFIDYPGGLSCDAHREAAGAAGSVSVEGVTTERRPEEEEQEEEEEESLLSAEETTMGSSFTLVETGMNLNGYFPQVAAVGRCTQGHFL